VSLRPCPSPSRQKPAASKRAAGRSQGPGACVALLYPLSIHDFTLPFPSPPWRAPLTRPPELSNADTFATPPSATHSSPAPLYRADGPKLTTTVGSLLRAWELSDMEQQSTVLVLFCSGCTNHMSRATMSQKNQLPSPDSEPRGCQELEKEASVFLPSLVPSHSPQARALQRPEGPAMQIVPVAIWTADHRCVSNVHPRTEGFATDMTPSAPLSPQSSVGAPLTSGNYLVRSYSYT
jgi:hypothetical protein